MIHCARIEIGLGSLSVIISAGEFSISNGNAIPKTGMIRTEARRSVIFLSLLQDFFIPWQTWNE